jgi:hypothetical protein
MEIIIIFMEDKVIQLRPFLVTACQMAYRKHVLDDDSIGWDELGEVLKDALCNVMTDENFVEWVKSVKKQHT